MKLIMVYYVFSIPPTVYAHYDILSQLINMEKYILFVIDMVFSKFINL